MLSISQSGFHFNYINWVPSAKGPLINAAGTISYDKPDLNSSRFYQNLFSTLVEKNDVNPPVICLSLDSSQVNYSEMLLDQVEYDQFILDWVTNLNYDSNFKEKFYTYSYNINSDKRKLLNIHLKKSKRDAIFQAIKKLKFELRSFSIGIFSAEQTTRFCFNAERLNSYLVWRIGSYNQNQILLITNGQLESFIIFKRLENTYNLQNFFGSREMTDNLFSQLEKCKDYNLSNLSKPEKIFIYSSNGTSLEIRKYLDSNDEKVCHINPIEKMNSNIEIKSALNYKFADSGDGFRGIDV